MSFRTQIFSSGLRAIIALAVPLVMCASLEAAIFRVDINVPPGGAGNGSSWPDAFKYLRDALTNPFLAAGDEIWVAQGFYYPDECDTCGLNGTDLQTDFFDVLLEVKVYGGFPTGGGDGTFGARNPAAFETVLSGDIDANDLTSPANNPSHIQGFNSFHVLTIINLVDPAPQFFLTVVDGFTITAGNANHPDPQEKSLRVGGGAYVAAIFIILPPLPEGPKFQNIIFVGNRSEDVGGALACADVGVEVRDCLILNNETLGGHFLQDPGQWVTIGGGGGIAAPAPFVLVNSRIVGNKCVGAGGGGGVSAWDDGDIREIVFASCLFAGNKALMDADDLGGYGGGARIQTGEVMNCAFTANVADLGNGPGTFLSGGGLRADDTVAVYLSSFYKNDAPNGGGGGVAFTSTQGTITNSIAWENTDKNNPNGGWREQIFGPSTGPCPTWSNVQGWDCGFCFDCPTFHNICADPYFVDPDGPDDMLGTEDDHLRLRLNSPSFDKGSDLSPLHVPLDSGDVNDDGMTTEELPWDLQGNTRKFNAGVAIDTGNEIDQGAYEASCFACPWDLDGDRTVGVKDLLILLGDWGQRCKHANFVDPDIVDQLDLDLLRAHWGNCSNVCTLESGSGPSPELEAATQLMGFAGSEAHGEWLRNEATDQLAEVSGIVLSALLQD